MIIERATFSIHHNNDGITELKLNEACTIDLEASKEMEYILSNEFKKERILLLVISGQTTSVTKESREYSAKNPLMVKAMAVMAKSLPQKIASNFIMAAYRKLHPTYPVKMFMNREKAVTWLMKQK